MSFTHGTAGAYTNHACRCPRCTEAHRQAQQTWTRPARTTGNFEHGRAAYCNYGCRCRICTEANTAYQALRRNR